MEKVRDKPLLVVIGGPTAGGKSRLALELARRFRGTLLVGDSRQIYRGFDIGTAKPTREEQAAVPHRLVDLAEPDAPVTVAQYRLQALRAIDEILLEGRLPMLVGGTGLYLRAVMGDLEIPPVAPDPVRRERLLAQGRLHERLRQVDPAAAVRIHPNDHHRLVRALEVYEVTGQPISVWQARRHESPFRVVFLGLAPERKSLRERIADRTQRMIAQGWLAEVRSLVAQYGEDLPMLDTLGYAELLPVVRDERSLQEAMGLIIQNTCRYAKRQLTWFSREPHLEWVPESEFEAMVEWAERQLRSRMP